MGKTYEFFEGYSAGLMMDMDASEIQEALERDGVTLVHYKSGGRRLFIDDSVNPEYADLIKKTQECVEVDELHADRRQYPDVASAVGYAVRELNHDLLSVPPDVEDEALPYISGLFLKKPEIVEKSMDRTGASDQAKELVRRLMDRKAD